MDQTEIPAFTQLKEHLRKMFQLDRGDLDFGIYRIMNMRRQVVEDFLDNRLLPQVRSILDSYRPAELEKAMQEMEDAENHPGKYLPEYLEKLEKIINSDFGVDKMEVEIYSDLYNFFSRYYSDGDFLSLRRYKEGVYALPYEGEEVKLHWANHDQYYIKTSENLKHYAFRVPDGRRVRFAIKNGGTEKNNNKAANGKERRFILTEDEPVVMEKGEATIYFDYHPDKAKRSQDKINEESLKMLLANPELAEFGISTPTPTDNNQERTLLEKHLATFTAKFTFDYFIHKDLEGFLRRELDFYIKNEIMHLDDIENEKASNVETYLAKIRALRQVAGKIIQFLAQIENFQKKLWLKKKFVLETNYIITLDRIIGKEAESDLLTQIAANDEQREEWVQLFAIDELDGYSSPLTEAFLKANDKLQLDTRLFDAEFKYTLLASINNLDDVTNGLLINSENFQALNVLMDKYRQIVDTVHIDPPYNTDTSGFLYKNSHRHSTWLSMMENRLDIARQILSADGVCHIHIDENEYERLHLLVSKYNYDYTGTLVWDKRNPMNGGSGLANQHEYVLMMTNNSYSTYRRSGNAQSILTKAKELISQAGKITDEVRSEFAQWMNGNGDLSGGEKAYRYIDEEGRVYQSVSLRAPEPRDDQKFHQPLLHPKTGEPCAIPPNGFSRTPETLATMMAEGLIIFGEDEKTQPRQKVFLSRETQRQLSSILQDAKRGMQDVAPMGGHFPYCHPVSLYEELLGTRPSKDSLVLDYFAGSGTTGHAMINLNRDDDGQRKYILVEMGEYFDKVTKPRVQKAAYSKDWKDGKPVSREGVSQIIKVMSLEQYEDTLDNLNLKQTQEQTELLSEHPEMHEGYMLKYMMDIESRGSASLLDLDAFDDPFSYNLNTMQDDELKPMAIDLVETFNYLLGLKVNRIARDPAGVVTVRGTNSNHEECLILWRNVENMGWDALDAWFKDWILDAGIDVDVVYVNGDNNLGNLKPDKQHWEVRLIEAEFKQLMFDVQEL